MSSTLPRRHVQIGERIRAIRTAQKRRQVDVAAAAGMSWRHLIRMERGEGGEPKLATLDRIAEALGVDRSELTGEDDDEESDPAMQEAFSLFVDLMDRINARKTAEVEA